MSDVGSDKSNSKKSGGTLRSLEDSFASCSISVRVGDDHDGPVVSPPDKATAMSFYRDSSGRARLSMKMQLKASAEEDWVNLQKIIADDSDKDDDDNDDDSQDEAVVDFEESSLLVKCRCCADTLKIEVEGIRILSSQIVDLPGREKAIELSVEIVVRGSIPNNSDSVDCGTSTEGRELKEEIESDHNSCGDDALTLTELEVRAVLQLKKKSLSPGKHEQDPLSPFPFFSVDNVGLLALEMGSGVLPNTKLSSEISTAVKTQHYNTKYISSVPVVIQLELVKSLTVSIREVKGSRAAVGATLVSLTVAHSNLHQRPVTITNIALHPGHSRPVTNNYNDTISNPIQHNRSMQGGEILVVNMSQHVTWGYASGTNPSLPLVLSPNEAFATVLQIDAGQNLTSRTFLSPVAITAFVNDITQDKLVTAADVQWSTARVAIQPADAFRIDMSLRGSKHKVGAPFVVSLKVLNLSIEDRDLMLLMAKDEDGGKRNGKPGTLSAQNVNTAVVSEVNGYTFGVWGLAGEDDGTARHNRDHELLAVDAALLLGEVKGQHSIEAELRFVPLREGTLDVPNLKLYDKTGGKWYNCIHTLNVVVGTS